MTFDPGKLLAMPPIVTRQAMTERDTMLYALGVGATDLRFVYEAGLVALPTMPVIMGYPGFIWRNPELGVDWRRVLHGEQSTVIHAPLPTQANIRGETVIEAIYDKGAEKGSLAVVARRVFDADSGVHLATVRAGTFLRGNGGHGGSEGNPQPPRSVPERPADAIVELSTATNQAVLYRLSGDYNPLHIDPEVAEAAGFPRPILHGLCTYGIAGRALVSALCDHDPAALRRIDVRFSAPVYPGETIVTEVWHLADGAAAFRAKVAERGVVVLNNGYAEFN